jgi:hypothetical protein
MCTFQDQQQVLVCDVAIGKVCQAPTAEGQGTLVQAPASVASEQFQTLACAAIVLAKGQSTDASPARSEPDA